MRLLCSFVILSALAAGAQSAPPPPPALPLDTAPPLSTSCTSARDCPQLGYVCELPAGPASRGVCSPAPASAPCNTDSSCGSARHCGELRLILEHKTTRWLGVCLPGRRTPADGPAPLATNGLQPLRFEYAGAVPPGYVLLERPDMRALVPGLILFTASYALSQLWLVFLRWNAWSLMPLAGPLTQFLTMQGSVSARTQGEFNLALVGTVGQVLGATAIIVGLAKPTRWLERSSVALVPGPGGVTVVGTF